MRVFFTKAALFSTLVGLTALMVALGVQAQAAPKARRSRPKPALVRAVGPKALKAPRAAATIYDADPNMEFLLMNAAGGPGERGKVVTDAKARSGWARQADPKIDPPGGGTMWYGYTYGQSAGKLRVFFRLKVADNRLSQPVVTVRTSITDSDISQVADAGDRAYDLKGTDFKQSNVYQEFSFDLTKGETGFASFLVYTEGLTQVAFDGLRVQQVTRFLPQELIGLLQVPPKPTELAIGPDAGFLEVQGLYSHLWRLPEAMQKLVPALLTKTSALIIHPQRTRVEDFPKTWDSLYGFSVIALNNVPVNAVTTTAAIRLKQWVEDGGTLLLLGDTHGLTRGGWNDSPLSELLPVTLQVENGLPPRHALRLESGDEKLRALDWSTRPTTFYLHSASLREGSTVWVSAESHPLIAEKRVGKGRVLVFLLSVLGEKKAGENAMPFWEWTEWPVLVARVVEGKNK